MAVDAIDHLNRHAQEASRRFPFVDAGLHQYEPEITESDVAEIIDLMLALALD